LLLREPTSHFSHIDTACRSIGVTNASKAITYAYTNLVTLFCHIPAMQLETCRGNDAETRNSLLIIKHNYPRSFCNRGRFSSRINDYANRLCF